MTAPGMLKKFIATFGLVLTAPIAILLIQGEITLLDAGTRAGILFGAVLVLRSVANLFPATRVVVAAPPAQSKE